MGRTDYDHDSGQYPRGPERGFPDDRHASHASGGASYVDCGGKMVPTAVFGWAGVFSTLEALANALEVDAGYLVVHEKPKTAAKTRR